MSFTRWAKTLDKNDPKALRTIVLCPVTTFNKRSLGSEIDKETTAALAAERKAKKKAEKAKKAKDAGSDDDDDDEEELDDQEIKSLFSRVAETFLAFHRR